MDFEASGGYAQTSAACRCRSSVPSPARSLARRHAFLRSRMQVALDRAGFSPGQIDGRNGSFTSRAREAYVEARKASIELATDPLRSTRSPRRMPRDRSWSRSRATSSSRRPSSRSPTPLLVEALAERFHASPALLKALNPTAPFTAGSTITVPAVEPFRFRAGRDNGLARCGNHRRRRRRSSCRVTRKR